MAKRNEHFRSAYDWLVANRKVKDQKDLSWRIGVGATSISRIMQDKVEPSDDTLHKLNSAFGGIFNMAYLRGESDVMMAGPSSKPADTSTNEHAAEMSIIELAASLIKENEALRRQLQDTIEEVKSLREEMSRDRDAISTIRTSLSDLLYRSSANTIPIAAEPES
ncbi:MAG: helix-turn-helix domain-containing protein [Bacteroidaceae bacterium]|nr:helix-turn-helix domain-containing protein [Bacteroidaceae bacterium]